MDKVSSFGRMCIFLFYLTICLPCGRSEVLELDSSFGEFWNNGTPWLVNFYAPWCGHCRRLSPVYTEVSQTLSEIAPSTRVARLDASSHRDIAKKFQINGFPTLKFFDAERTFEHDAERTSKSIVSFALRAHGPAVKRITDSVAFERNVTFFDSDPFYLLIGQPVQQQRHKDSALKVAFYEAAERFRLLTWFLTVVPDALPERFTALCQVTGPIDERLVVFKDGTCLAYSEPPASDKSTVTEHVSDWILRERYPSFQELHLSSLWEFGEAEIAASKSRIYRLVALFLLPQSYQTDSNSRRFFELGQSLAQQRLKHLSRYRFAWTEAYAALGDLAMVNLSAPSMVVVDPVTQVIYLNPNQSFLGGLFTLEPEVVVSFLLAVSEGRVQGFGGNSFLVRLQRIAIMIRGVLVDLLTNHPLISLLMLGIPVALLSFVCYLCFCLDDRYDDYDDLETEVAKLLESDNYYADSAVDRIDPDHHLQSRVAVQDQRDVDLDVDGVDPLETKKTR